MRLLQLLVESLARRRRHHALIRIGRIYRSVIPAFVDRLVTGITLEISVPTIRRHSNSNAFTCPVISCFQHDRQSKKCVPSGLIGRPCRTEPGLSIRVSPLSGRLDHALGLLTERRQHTKNGVYTASIMSDRLSVRLFVCLPVTHLLSALLTAEWAWLPRAVSNALPTCPCSLNYERAIYALILPACHVISCTVQ